MSKAKAIGAAAKVVKKTARRIQSRKEVSRDAFDKSKVKTGGVKVTKISKTTTPKKTATKKTATKKTAVKKTAVKKTTAKRPPKTELSAPPTKPVKKVTKATTAKRPTKKVAVKKTPKKTTSTPPNASGTSERAGIGGRRSTKDSLKSAASQQESRIVKSETSLAKNTPKPKKPKASKPTKPKRKGPSATAKRNARRKKLLRARDEKRLSRKLIRGAKTAAKKSGVPLTAFGAGYGGARMGSRGNVADAAKQKTTGFTQAELDAARMRYYGGR